MESRHFIQEMATFCVILRNISFFECRYFLEKYQKKFFNKIIFHKTPV